MAKVLDSIRVITFTFRLILLGKVWTHISRQLSAKLYHYCLPTKMALALIINNSRNMICYETKKSNLMETLILSCIHLALLSINFPLCLSLSFFSLSLYPSLSLSFSISISITHHLPPHHSLSLSPSLFLYLSLSLSFSVSISISHLLPPHLFISFYLISLPPTPISSSPFLYLSHIISLSIFLSLSLFHPVHSASSLSLLSLPPPLSLSFNIY